MNVYVQLPLVRLCLLTCAFCFSALTSSAQQRHDPAHNHEEELIPLDEIVISAPLDRPLHQQAQAASIMTAEQLNLALEPSLGQTLARLPGVSSSYFGPAASRPIIRGLEGDRVRILQNGLNTIDASAASPDHAVSFEASNLKSVEVIRLRQLQPVLPPELRGSERRWCQL